MKRYIKLSKISIQNYFPLILYIKVVCMNIYCDLNNILYQAIGTRIPKHMA